MNGKRYRVPHCRECDRCRSIVLIGTDTKEYRCYKDKDFNKYGNVLGILGVDHPPKTSPKWCPKRVKE